ncbi:MAG: class I SAM-dependent methyltransferase [bacterium]
MRHRSCFSIFVLILSFVFVPPYGLSAAGSDTGTVLGTIQSASPAASALAPVYAPLAEWIVKRFDLTDKKGIGIDLGGGSGHLIIELCRRTRALHWINADLDPECFYRFSRLAESARIGPRVSALWADAQNLPFRDDFAEIIVSRGSFQFWPDLHAAFREIHRVLKPGGSAIIGRGFSENLPPETARQVREKQQKGSSFPKYNVDETEKQLRQVMNDLGITHFQILRPQPPGSGGINYGIWLIFEKKRGKEYNMQLLK